LSALVATHIHGALSPRRSLSRLSNSTCGALGALLKAHATAAAVELANTAATAGDGGMDAQALADVDSVLDCVLEAISRQLPAAFAGDAATQAHVLCSAGTLLHDSRALLVLRSRQGGSQLRGLLRGLLHDVARHTSVALGDTGLDTSLERLKPTHLCWAYDVLSEPAQPVAPTAVEQPQRSTGGTVPSHALSLCAVLGDALAACAVSQRCAAVMQLFARMRPRSNAAPHRVAPCFAA
jgi:hypothetical protein